MSIGYNKYLKNVQEKVVKRSWNKKYSKKKTSYEIINDKLSYLNNELKKTGMISESPANSTSGVYTVTGFDSGVPEVPAIPAVPPTYENVTGGLSNPNDFVWGNQGDGSDPNAAINIPSNLYTTYNGEQVAAARQIEGTYPNGVMPLGFILAPGWLSTNYVGYLSSGGFTLVASVGVFANASTDLGRAYQEAYYRWPFPGKIEKTIYLWSSLDCLFGTCRGASEFYPSNLSATSTPKADRALYAYTLWIPAGADGNVLPNRIMTDPGSPEIPAIPAIPPRPIVISRNALGDPNYFPGFIKNIQDLLGLGDTAIKAIMDYTSKLIAPLADALGIVASRLSTYAAAAPPFIAHLAQQQGLVNYTDQNPFQVYFSPQESANVSNTLSNVLQTIPRERWENLNSEDLTKINSVMNNKDFGQYSYTFYNIGNPQAFAGRIKTDPNTGLSYVSGIQDNYIFTSDLDAAGVPGAKELLYQAMTANTAQNRSDMQSSPYTYTPGVPDPNTPELKQKNTPVATNLPAPQLTQSSFNSLPPSVQKQVMDTMKQNYLNQFSASNYQGKELSSYRDAAKETQKQVAQNTQFKNGYMIQTQVGVGGRTITTKTPLFKENKTHKSKLLNEAIDIEDVKLKLREIDVLRHYKVSEKESKELEDIIYKINLILDENPEHLEYLKQRYPRDDVRLAELNYKMDQMLSASEEYIDTHFPENQKLFTKVQQSIKRNIKLTDPKTFKNIKDPITYKKLLSVDYVNEYERPKKKTKLKSKNKKTASRFLKKPRVKTKSELIDEKIKQLDNDMKKTQKGA
jgi:hypothetical protein